MSSEEQAQKKAHEAFESAARQNEAKSQTKLVYWEGMDLREIDTGEMLDRKIAMILPGGLRVIVAYGNPNSVRLSFLDATGPLQPAFNP